MGLLTKIANNRRPVAAATALEDRATAVPALSSVPTVAIPTTQIPTTSRILSTPPTGQPIPCLICSCPIFWISTYDLSLPPSDQQLRCGECDPPPGRSLVGAKWIIVQRTEGPAWKRYRRGGGNRPEWLDEPNLLPVTDEAYDDACGDETPDCSRWVDLTLPDGSTALAHPAWRRINPFRVAMLFGDDEAWQILQRRTDRFLGFSGLVPGAMQ